MKPPFVLRQIAVASSLAISVFTPLPSAAQTPGDVRESLTPRAPLPTAPGDQGVAVPAPAPKVAPAVPPGGKKIPIQRFEITGNEAVSTDTLREIVSQREGQALTLFEIYDVADAVEKYYHEHGYTAASVSVPAQRVDSGTVRLEVIEGRIGEVRIEGNKRYRERLLERYLGNVGVGKVIQSSEWERELLLLNDLPGLTARGVIEKGKEYGESNFVLRTEEDTFEYAARVNNYGRTSIGEWRLEGDLGINAPLGWGDRIDINGLWSEGNNLNYVSARYSVPIYYSGTRAAVYYNEYNYEVASGELPRAARSLDIQGDGDNFGVMVTHPVIRSRKQNLFASVGFDRTETKQETDGLGLREKQDIGLLVLGALYSRENANHSFSSVNATFSTNFNANDRNPATHPTRAGRPENNAQTAKLRIDASHYQPFGPLWAAQARATLAGSIDPLVDTERFRVGGRENVRAYASSEIAGDGGYALSLELFRYLNYLPYLPARASVFVDTGTVTRQNAAVIGQLSSQSISGAGGSLVVYFQKHYEFDLELATPLGGYESADTRDDIRAWIGFKATF